MPSKSFPVDQPYYYKKPMSSGLECYKKPQMNKFDSAQILVDPLANSVYIP